MDINISGWHGTANPQENSNQPDPERWPTGVQLYAVLGIGIDNTDGSFHILVLDINNQVSLYPFPLDADPPFVLQMS